MIEKDWILNLFIKETTQSSMEPEDYYYQGGNMVMTEQYHKKRGYCCKNGCKHCPY